MTMSSSGLLFILVACGPLAFGAACGARGASTVLADVPAPAGSLAPKTNAPDAGVPLTREEEELNRRPLKLPLTEPKVVVEKGARRLRLYMGDELVRVRRVVLGFEPAGDKVKQGDGRTPEGDFYVCMKNERSKFYLSLGLSYPNAEDAERGLRDSLISKAEHRSITRSLAAGRCPPWNTALGGEVFIHGGGTASDWTWGCIALENLDIKELFESLPAGAPVNIKP